MSSSAPSFGVVIAKASEAKLVKGRREFLTFRDLGVDEATAGRFGAVVINAKQGLKQSTGWHYHECELQMIYILNGWSRMQFEDGTDVTLEAGDMFMLPGGIKHNEVETSDELEALEFTSPAVMGTVPCDPPPGAPGV